MAKAPLILPALLLTGIVALPANAQADGVHISGGVRVDAAAHVRVGPPVHARVRARGHVSLGIRFATPPPPPPPVPSYYVEPVYVEPPPTIVAPLVVPRMRRWGIGAYAGSFDVGGQDAGGDVGLLGRYRFTRALSLEAEASQSTLNEGRRINKRVGAALLYDLAPERTLSPYLLAGAGFGHTAASDGEFHAEQAYGEVGLGLTYRVTRGLHLIGDVRAGARENDEDVTYRSVGPVEDFQEDERFSRVRFGALYFF